MKKIKPILRNILIRRIPNKIRSSSGIELAGQNKFSAIADVIDFGRSPVGHSAIDDYPHLMAGNRILGPKKCNHTINDDGLAIISTGDIRCFFIDSRPVAINGHVLIYRNIDEEISNGGIIIPWGTYYKDQSMTGWVSGFSINRKYKYAGSLAKGDFVQIDKWSNSIIELEYNGQYHLSVPEELLLFKSETIKRKTFLPCKGCGVNLEEYFVSYCKNCALSRAENAVRNN